MNSQTLSVSCRLASDHRVHVHDFHATICTVLGMANTAVNRWACFLFSECRLPPPSQVLSLAGRHAQNGKSLDFSGSRGSWCL